MAATDAAPIPTKNQAYRVTFPILDADGDLVTAATGLDSEVSKDGGTFTDCASEATEIATGSGMYFLDLTASEMNADTVAIVVKTTSSGAKTTPMVLYPNKSGGLAVNVTAWAGNATATTNLALKSSLAKSTDITGFNDLSAAQVNAECDTALSDVGVTTTVTGRIDAAVSTRATPAQVDTSLTTYGALKPTVAGRTLDVTTTGEAGLDFANTAGTIPDSAGVTTLLGRISSTLFTGITSLKEWLGLLAGKQVGNSTARTEIRSSGAGSGTYDETTDSQEAIRDRGDTSWITGAGGDPWSTALPGAYASGTAGNIIGNRLDVAVSTRSTYAGADTPGTTTLLSRVPSALTITAGKVDVSDKTGFALTAAYDPAKTAAQPGNAMTLTAPYDPAKSAASQASVDAVAGYVDSEVAAIKSQTDKLTFTGTDLRVTLDGEQVSMTVSAMNDVADAILKRDWTALGGEAAYSLLNAARMLRNKWDTTGGTLTVRKEDGTATAWTRTLATDPAAQPIVGAS